MILTSHKECIRGFELFPRLVRLILLLQLALPLHFAYEVLRISWDILLRFLIHVLQRSLLQLLLLPQGLHKQVLQVLGHVHGLLLWSLREEFQVHRHKFG